VKSQNFKWHLEAFASELFILLFVVKRVLNNIEAIYCDNMVYSWTCNMF